MYLWLTTYWLYKLSYSNHMSVFISEWGESTPCVYIYYVSYNTWHNSPIWIGNPWNSISFKREYCMKKSTLCQIYFILVSTFQLLVEIKRNYWRVIFLENSILKNIEYMNKLNYYIMLYAKNLLHFLRLVQSAVRSWREHSFLIHSCTSQVDHVSHNCCNYLGTRAPMLSSDVPLFNVFKLYDLSLCRLVIMP